MREVKPVELSLTKREADDFLAVVIESDGGLQGLMRRLQMQLAGGGQKVRFEVADAKDFFRFTVYMTQYGSGGYQGYLRKAFARAFGTWLGPPFT
jgi:hypothetical protein